MTTTITCTTCSDVIFEGVVPECFVLADNLMCQECTMSLEWFEDVYYSHHKELFSI